jgi:hypothetical protein
MSLPLDHPHIKHATVAFTMDIYTEVAEELAEAAAEAIAAFIPRHGQPGLGS